MTSKRPSSQRPVRVKQAASLIALQVGENPHDICVLMGRRRADLSFLPGVFVFPGGRVEPTDKSRQTPAHLCPLSAKALDQEQCLPWQAYVAAAFRETYEETGFDLAGSVRGSMIYLARAITPARFPRRYDTRFVRAVIDTRQGKTIGHGQRDGELTDIDWYTWKECVSLPLHRVTETVLAVAFGLQGESAHGSRLLIADRRPKHWQGAAPVSSRSLENQRSLVRGTVDSA